MNRAVFVALALPALAVAAPVSLPELRVLVREGVVVDVPGLKSGVIPATWRLVRAGGLDALASRELALATPLERSALPSLRAHARRGACRLVVHAEGGLTSDDVTVLEQIGPCFYELHVGAPPFVHAKRLARVRPLAVVWEAGSEVPDQALLARFADAFQGAQVAVSADRAGSLLEGVKPFGERLGVGLRSPGGVLDPTTLGALKAAERVARVTVYADGGLDLDAARELRELERASVVVALDRLTKIPAPVLDALRALARPVDPANERRVGDDLLEAPLLRPH